MSVSDISTPFVKLHSQVKIIDDLLGGTAAMRNAGTAYLHQMSLESKERYQKRLERSTLYPALSETLSQMTGRVFFKPIDVQDVNQVITDRFLPDVDMLGNNLDVFAARWFYASLAYGVSYVLVDYTKINDVRTLADEIKVGARPYLVHIKPQSVLGFKTAMHNGRQVLTQFRYTENVVVDKDEFTTETMEQINVYEIGRVRKYQKRGEDFELVDDVELKIAGKRLDFIPIVAFATKNSGEFMLGEPPLMELAYLNIKHWQSQSDQDNILNTARVPLLARFGVNQDPTSPNTMQIGGSLIDLPENGDLRYIEHSGNAIGAGQESLKMLESQIQMAGASLLVKSEIAMTDSQTKEEHDKLISKLRLYANRFEDVLDLTLEYVGKWLGVEKAGSVEITGNIDSDIDANSSIESIIKLQAAGIISAQTAFSEAKRRGLISDNVEWEDEQARLENGELNGFDS
ncbi:DUF4055 domain-containing protein [Avibacterium sp. 20-15]|uniref:DUF4055 domain-containing protein n=1 Tax=unclassified Avibacterium TaxID=2685287 RepID=UPI00202756DB|nr:MULTISPECIES: DUF4055 domain-containing protein [unclassified Avibacterium]MCW9731921.1 DUF4055 domain-containing protein [Avibacterium sp. 20-15]URL04110.1 DUF4055 domain-containing protein [Avibacterium sp. 20-132]